MNGKSDRNGIWKLKKKKSKREIGRSHQRFKEPNKNEVFDKHLERFFFDVLRQKKQIIFS